MIFYEGNMKTSALTIIVAFLISASPSFADDFIDYSLKQLTTSSDSRVRSEAADLLGQADYNMCPIAVVDTLTKQALSDNSDKVRTQALVSLAEINEKTTCRSDLFLSKLKPLLNDKSPYVRSAAIKLLTENHALTEKEALNLTNGFHSLSPAEKTQICTTGSKLPLSDSALIATFIKGSKDTHKDIAQSCTYSLLKKEGSISEKPTPQITPTMEVDLPTLIFGTNNISDYRDSQNTGFIDYPRIFTFCRNTRIYPCLTIIQKPNNGDLLRLSDSQPWSMPMLLMSKYGLAYNQRNGNTPQGVFEINSVMPVADNQNAYGKNRRLIMEYPEHNGNDLSELNKLIPFKLEQRDWINEVLTAQNNLRNNFRIHGSGIMQTETDAPYYPFVPSLGCVKVREGEYKETTYNEQRVLLDTLMGMLGLAPEYENETKIFGLLYIVNIDDRQAKVTLEDLKIRGID